MMRRDLLSALFPILLCALIVAAYPCTKAAAQPLAMKVLRLGLDRETLLEVNPRDVRIAFQLWVEALVKDIATGYKIEASIIDGQAALIDAIRSKKVDFIVLNGLNFMSIRESAPLDPFLTHFTPNGVGRKFLLLVRKKAKIGSLSQLRRKGVIVGRGNSGRIPSLWLKSLVQVAGHSTNERFFRRIRTVTKGSRAILPVFFGSVDAAVAEAAVFEMMKELNPQIGKELTVLAKSPRYLDTITCFRGNFEDRHIRKLIMENAWSIHQHPKGRQILTLYRVHKVVRFEERYTAPLRALLDGPKRR